MKKLILIILGACLVAAVAGAVVWGKDYYESRYVGETFYAQVPQDYDNTPEMIVDDTGDDVGEGVHYVLDARNEKGEQRTADFHIYLDSQQPLQPGTCLKLSLSKTLVVGWEAVDKGDVPAGVLAAL
jgi:uncharacterized protein (TIGR01655 family)